MLDVVNQHALTRVTDDALIMERTGDVGIEVQVVQKGYDLIRQRRRRTGIHRNAGAALEEEPLNRFELDAADEPWRPISRLEEGGEPGPPSEPGSNLRILRKLQMIRVPPIADLKVDVYEPTPVEFVLHEDLAGFQPIPV